METLSEPDRATTQPVSVDLSSLSPRELQPTLEVELLDYQRVAPLVVNHDGSTAFAIVGETQTDLWRCALPYFHEATAVLAVASMVLFLLVAWRVRRRRIVRAWERNPDGYCRRCGYPCRGLLRPSADAPPNCPECGLALDQQNRTSRQPSRLRKGLWSFAVVLFFGILIASGWWWRQEPGSALHFQWNPGWYSSTVWRYAKRHDIQWLTSRINHRRMLLALDTRTGETRELPLPPSDGLNLSTIQLEWHTPSDRLLMRFEKKDSGYKPVHPFGQQLGRQASFTLATLDLKTETWETVNEYWRYYSPNSLVGYVFPSFQLAPNGNLVWFDLRDELLTSSPPTGPVRPTATPVQPRTTHTVLYDGPAVEPGSGTYRAEGVWTMQPDGQTVLFQRHAFHTNWSKDLRFPADLVEINLNNKTQKKLGPLADDVSGKHLAFSPDGTITSVGLSVPRPESSGTSNHSTNRRFRVALFTTSPGFARIAEVAFEARGTSANLYLAGTPDRPTVMIGPLHVEADWAARPQAPLPPTTTRTFALVGPGFETFRLRDNLHGVAVSGNGRTVVASSGEVTPRLLVYDLPHGASAPPGNNARTVSTK